MQTEITKIQTLVQETANDNNWTGVNAQQILIDIDALTAVKRLNGKHLNIAELTAHLTCWNEVIARRLDAINQELSKEEDFPTINELSKEKWNELKEDFFESFDLLIEKLKSKNDNILEQPMFEGSTSVYRNLHGQISHLHYHLGQIMLLKKILA
ncbi:MAG: DinB family protein [Chitinophagales bacterium]